MTSVRRRVTLAVAVCGTALAGAIITAPLIGSTSISLQRALDWSIPFAENADAQIFFIARLPRTLAGAMVGATLAAAGAVFQALLRNPLATPYTLGIDAGASLGAMLAITFGPTVLLLGVPISPVASYQGLSTHVLLLAGVTLNAFFSALILFVQYFADFADTFRMLRWLMGDLDVSSYQPLVTALPLVAIAFTAFAWLARPLNLLSLGVDAAESRGLDAVRAQRLAFLSGSLATGAAVSIAGPIGFVGIIVPHLVRLIVGADHRVVLPAAALFGGAFLIACDALARTVMAPLELPVGVITAMIGGPFFLWILVKRT
jgi:iron complex transport system permease protein